MRPLVACVRTRYIGNVYHAVAFHGETTVGWIQIDFQLVSIFSDYTRKKQDFLCVGDESYIQQKQFLSHDRRKNLFPLKTSNISDSKRQQTITVDYKRLINGFFLTDGFSLRRKSEMDMKQFEYVPEIQSELGQLTKAELRKYVLDYYKNNLKGKEIINRDTGITIHFSMTSGRKTAMGEAMYQKKAEMIKILPELVEYAIYNNFGKRKPDESDEIIGYLNFKGRCKLDDRIENVRIAVQFQRSAKFYYNIEVNMIK